MVFENLLDNQIRYTTSKVDISIASDENSDGSALIHIYNDGPHIEKEIMDTLFDKYHKGYRGKSGLGLAIVHRIISLHGGKIWVINEEEGVSFYVEISGA